MSKSSKVDKQWFSAAELALLGRELVAGLPKSVPGCKGRAGIEAWETRVVQGKGGKGGMRTEYKPTGKIMQQIQEYLTKHDTNVLNEPYAEYSNEQNDDHQSDSIYIEHYTDVRAAAGIGQITPTDAVSINIAINAADWQSYIGLSTKHLKIISVYGDSMKPTLQHGDQILVDTACHTFIDDALYVIQQRDNLRVKRIKLRLDGSIEVKSDNNIEFSPEIYTAGEAADFRIIGKVLPFKFGRFDL